MCELGSGTSGINPHYGPTRNPHDRKKIAGGSSSGSASLVAAGLCPIALGVDGGGSVRMPTALCGVVGLKPTFARIPLDGVLPLNWTVGTVGILAGTVEDALIVLDGSLRVCLKDLGFPSLSFHFFNPTSARYLQIPTEGGRARTPTAAGASSSLCVHMGLPLYENLMRRQSSPIQVVHPEVVGAVQQEYYFPDGVVGATADNPIFL